MSRKRELPKGSKARLLLLVPALLVPLAVVAARAAVGFEPSAAPPAKAVGRFSPSRARAGTPLEPTATGAGTVNRLAKWQETGGVGGLTDSSIYESGGLTFFGLNGAGQVAPLVPTSSDYHVLEVGALGTKTPLTLAGGSGLMEFWKDQAGGNGWPSAAVAFGMARPGQAAAADMVFSTYTPAAGWNERARITTDGKLVVGTAPGNALRLDVNGAAHVSGEMVVDGNIAAKYQDVAEWVPSTQKLSAGTVVVLDAARTNHVMASATAYDTKVAGVVSAEPGVILGIAGDDKVKVATTGRVRVKVDASRGAIRVGDLLVTSAVEGVAMKSMAVDLGGVSIHRPGTIIGKALEPLKKGTGELLVLLSLQ